jgi:hypothetical protein
MGVSKSKEIIVPADHADEDNKAALCLTKTIPSMILQSMTDQLKKDFHRVGGGLIFPLSGVISAIDTIEQRRRSWLERNEKLLVSRDIYSTLHNDYSIK